MSQSPPPSSPDSARSQATVRKRAYQRPVLVRYGTLSEVTRAQGMHGANDGAPTGPNKKTRA